MNVVKCEKCGGEKYEGAECNSCKIAKVKNIENRGTLRTDTVINGSFVTHFFAWLGLDIVGLVLTPVLIGWPILFIVAFYPWFLARKVKTYPMNGGGELVKGHPQSGTIAFLCFLGMFLWVPSIFALYMATGPVQVILTPEEEAKVY